MKTTLALLLARAAGLGLDALLLLTYLACSAILFVIAPRRLARDLKAANSGK